MRLLQALRFPNKAVLVSSMFVLPIVLLAGGLWSSTQQTIAIAEQERAGVVAMRALAPVYEGVLQTRFAARSGLGGLDTANDSRQAREQTEKAIAALEQSIKATGDPVGLAPGVAKFQAAWRAAVQAPPGAAGAEGHDPLDAATADLLALLTQLSDDSKLALDPDIDSSYLTAAMVTALLPAAQDLGRVWGWGTFALSRGWLDEPDVKRFRVWSANAASKLAEARNDIDRSVAARPALKTRLDLARIDAALAFQKAANTQVESGSGDARTLYSSGLGATTGLFRFYAGGLDALDDLLAARIRAAEQARQIRFALVLACLVLAAYLFHSFYLVTKGSLDEITHHLDAMAEGDLTTAPTPRGSDETAALMASLQTMQASLRNIVARVRGASQSIVLASGEIASASTDLSARTESAAANLEESASSMEHISSTVKRAAESVRHAASVASENAHVAVRGGAAIADVVNTMQDINASSNRIGDIIGTVDGIAFQTNILALNAAVEAARAGEQGRGFAVVASEVRGLAQRSARAAREITALVGASVQKIDSGSQVVRSAGETIQELVGNARCMNDLLTEISAAATEQSSGVAQVGTAVQELDQMTQQNAALVEQTAAAAAALKEQAHGLATEVARFKL